MNQKSDSNVVEAMIFPAAGSTIKILFWKWTAIVAVRVIANRWLRNKAR